MKKSKFTFYHAEWSAQSTAKLNLVRITLKKAGFNEEMLIVKNEDQSRDELNKLNLREQKDHSLGDGVLIYEENERIYTVPESISQTSEGIISWIESKGPNQPAQVNQCNPPENPRTT